MLAEASSAWPTPTSGWPAHGHRGADRPGPAPGHGPVRLARRTEAARRSQEARVRLQAAIGRQVRLKRTPQLSFAADPAVPTGQRVEDILAQICRRTRSGRRWLRADDRRAAEPSIDGLVVVDKPAGMTSHDVVARCRRIFGQKKVGHAGTLDPDATGVLLVGLGRATRLLQFLTELAKSYTGEVVLGVATSTLDASGEVTGRWDMRHVTLADARRARRPAHRADRPGAPDGVGGQDRRPAPARAGPRRASRSTGPARQVTVTASTCRPPPTASPGVTAAGRCFAVEVDCSSGTYVRSLAADLGAALGGGAHLRNLRRTAVGPLTAGRCGRRSTPCRRADVIAAGGRHARAGPGERRPTDVAAAIGSRQGARPGRARRRSGTGPWAVIGPDGDLLAVYEAHGGGTASSRRS